MWSLFSGAMGLDLGLESEGLAASLALEIDKDCCETIRHNRGEHLVLLQEDASRMTGVEMRRRASYEGEVWLVVGGPPCQAFSPGGNREALSDPRGNLVYEYFRLVSEIRPRYFVFENVANLVTAALKHRPIAERPGQHWSLKRYEAMRHLREDGLEPMEDSELAGSALKALLTDLEPLGYRFIFGVLDAADYGAPQHRLRFVMIGAREGLPPRLPRPTHGDTLKGLKPWATLRDAIWDLRHEPGRHYSYSPEFQELFSLVPPGGYWRDLPPQLQKVALGNAYASGGGKTGFFRRLSWDAPAPTVTGKPNRKGAAMCHPETVRPLSVRECARLQGFPDDWAICGTLEAQYRQIGNAVPVHLGASIGAALLRGEHTTEKELNVPLMLEQAIARLRSSGRNKRAQRKSSLQTELLLGV